MGAFTICFPRFFESSARCEHVSTVDADPVKSFIERIAPTVCTGILRVRLERFFQNAGSSFASRAVLVNVIQRFGERALKMMMREK